MESRFVLRTVIKVAFITQIPIFVAQYVCAYGISRSSASAQMSRHAWRGVGVPERIIIIIIIIMMLLTFGGCT